MTGATDGPGKKWLQRIYSIGAVAVKSTSTQTMFDDRNQSTVHHSVCGRVILCFVTKARREGCDLPKTDAKSDMHDTLILTTLMASPPAQNRVVESWHEDLRNVDSGEVGVRKSARRENRVATDKSTRHGKAPFGRSPSLVVRVKLDALLHYSPVVRFHVSILSALATVVQTCRYPPHKPLTESRTPRS